MRKSIFATFTAAVAVAAALLLTGCERAIDMTGRPVSFSAVAMDYAAGTRSNLPDTRVIYGDITGTGTKTQAIEWIKGDLITIHSPQCTRIQSDGDKQTCEYIVTEVGSDDASQAGIGLPYYIAEGLQWNGEGAYTFYALYPGMDTEGMTGNAIVAGEHVTITGTIPAVQGYGTITGETGKVVPPDMRNMYMAAKTDIDASKVGDDVELDFKPLTTAVELTVINQSKAQLELKSVSLTSASQALNGNFTADMDDITSGYPSCLRTGGTVTDGDRTVAISFDNAITLAYDADDIDKCGSLTFTFFLLPTQDVDDLTFTFTKSDDSRLSIRLGYQDGTGIVFPQFKKTQIKGLLLPEGAQLFVRYDGSLDSWTDGSEIPMTLEQQ